MTDLGFFSDIHLQMFVVSLVPHVSVFVETGAEEGKTTLWAAHKFGKVFTCEVNPAYIRALAAALEDNVELYAQTSPDFLREIKPHVGDLPLVFLDAHWLADWPLLDELRVIGSDYGPCVIIIHDCAVPNRPNFWACRGGGNDNPGPVLDWDYIKGALDFSRHTYRLFYPDYSASTPGYCVLFQDCKPMGYLGKFMEGRVLMKDKNNEP